MPGSERRENGEMLFNGCGVSVFQYKKVLEVGSTMMCIQLTLLNSKLINSYNGKFHSMCVLPQLKRKKKKRLQLKSKTQ